MKNTQNQYTTLTLTGSLFSNDMLSLMAQGQSSHQAVEDYKLLPGLRFSDEISRSFNIARALYNEYKKNRTETSAFDTTKKFIEEFFTKSLNYETFLNSSGKTIKDRSYPIKQYVAKNVPIIIAPYTFALDTPDGRFTVEGVTSRKKSAFALAQLFLNASAECTWAFATNGLEIRLLRDSDSMVRPSYLSFDLESILNDSRYPDFVALWYLIQASRVNVWETWRTEGITNGTRVREGLRDGVTNALLHLGAGFLKTEGEGNNALLNALKDGKRADGVPYTQMDFYKALLREVYRFLFLSTIEERDLLFAHSTDEVQLTPEIRKAHKIYREGYSIHRLAEKSRRIPANDKYTDIWHGVQVVFKALQQGNEKLDLSPLGGLFRADQCPLLDSCNIDNDHLLKAIRQLRWCYIDSKLTFTDYRNMGTEEFGSVYESLLELVPTIDLDSRSFSFVGIGDENGIDEEGLTAGNARKTSGSYYTNAELVNSLINSALIPAIENKISNESQKAKTEKREVNNERALLNFSVIDPSCGSGHFLLAAARKLAEKLVEIRSGEENPNQTEYRKALRDVITNCIYGIDLNDMAVELTRTALWLEGYEPGKPLEFLAHHVKCGNSLVGVYDLKILEKGIPNSAYAQLEGDEKDICTKYRKINENESYAKKHNAYQGDLFAQDIATSSGPLAQLMWTIQSIPNDTIENEEKKAELYNKLLQNKDFVKQKSACDMYTYAFFVEKTRENECLIPTSNDVYAIQKEEGELPYKQGIREKANTISNEYKFFHWKIEFPEVFQNNYGFDCILGNPPWDVSQLDEVEFFSGRYDSIAQLKGNERKMEIEKLRKNSPVIYNLFTQERRKLDCLNAYYTNSQNYPLTTVGKLNMYSLFAELILKLRSPNGNAGFIVPSGISTDNGTKTYLDTIVKGGLLSNLYGFENREKIFPIDSRIKFSLVTLSSNKTGFNDYAFFLRLPAELQDSRRHFSLIADDFALLNPNTKTSPQFRAQEDAKITKKIYKSIPVLLQEFENKKSINYWDISFKQGLYNMTSASSLFKKPSDIKGNEEKFFPLYEGKMIHNFDHHYEEFLNGKAVETDLSKKQDISYKVNPQFYVDKFETILKVANLPTELNALLRNYKNDPSQLNLDAMKNFCKLSSDENLKKMASEQDIFKSLYSYAQLQSPKYFIGFRDVTNATNERTMISSIVPLSAINNKLQLFLFSKKINAKLQSCFLANMCSLVFDYVTRQKMGGTDLNFFIVKQLPVLIPDAYNEKAFNFIVPRVMALTYTAKDIVEWAKALWQDSSLKIRLKMLQLNDDRNVGITDEKFVDREFTESFLPPYIYDDAKRAVLRAELDAYYARLYGLTRTELQYILEPQSVMGEDYPSETFRVLKDNEIAKYGEYRTQRLVLEAWDRLE